MCSSASWTRLAVHAARQDRLLASVNAEATVAMGVAFQNHLKTSADAVKKRQAALGTRIKLLDRNSTGMHRVRSLRGQAPSLRFEPRSTTAHPPLITVVGLCAARAAHFKKCSAAIKKAEAPLQQGPSLALCAMMP